MSAWTERPIARVCAICGQEFTRGSQYSYVRGLRVCRDSESCIESASITEGDRKRMAHERQRREELSNFARRSSGVPGGVQ